jgi:PAS domain S-box-containing protein
LPRKGGVETIYVNFVYEAFREGHGNISGVMAVANEVTQQVIAAKKIEQSEASFRLLADSMPQFIWTGDSQGHLYYYNQAVYDYSGLSVEQIQNEGWLQIVHPDEREENIRQWMHSIETGEDFVFHHRFKNKNGEYRWQLSRAIPLRDEDGKIQLWVGTSTDIHDHKLFEEELQSRVKERSAALEKTNEALVLSNKELARSNASLEEFAYAASHDLKEPIRKIHYFSERLKGVLSNRLTEEETSLFNRMETSVTRMGLLVDDLLTYSHVSATPPTMETINLNEKLKKVLDELELLIKDKNASVTVNKLPVIKGYPRQMLQLFQNLIGNAVKYHKPGINPIVEVSSKIVEGIESDDLQKPEPNKGPYYLIEVKDNGIGFEQKYADKIFKMFQRLHGKADYPGTGLGLSIAKKVVENHKGFITVESEPGLGSTFKIYLPIE